MYKYMFFGLCIGTIVGLLLLEKEFILWSVMGTIIGYVVGMKK